VGRKNILAWCRDIKNDWKSEFREGKMPEAISNESVDFGPLVPAHLSRKVNVYDPWKNKWITVANNSKVSLPSFKRSIMIKIERQA
jgi:hypothetical protein